MPAVVYAFLSTLGAVFVPTLIASRDRRSTTSAAGLSTIRATAASSSGRPYPLVLVVAPLGHLAGSSAIRAAGDRHRLAAQTLSRSLDTCERSREARPTTDQR